MHRYESHYGLPLGRRKGKKDAEPAEDDALAKKKSKRVQRKLEERRKDNKAKIDPRVEEQFLTGRLHGKWSVDCLLGEGMAEPRIAIAQ